MRTRLMVRSTAGQVIGLGSNLAAGSFLKGAKVSLNKAAELIQHLYIVLEYLE